jgi:hypothetical protein
MKQLLYPRLGIKLLLFAVLAGGPFLLRAQSSSTVEAETNVAVILTGGHDTDPRDRGRPVVLVASALNVPPEIFREAFSKVRPAPAGQAPEPDQVRKNKQALMESLTSYGVTNERLDAVSNYYRYNRSNGEMWRTTPATAYATFHQGVPTGVIVTNPGSGYSSAPTASIKGFPNLHLVVTLTFNTELAKNGAIKEIKCDSQTVKAM